MDFEKYLKVSHLENEGKLHEGCALLEELAENRDPMALIELGTRYITTEGYKPEVLEFEKDEEKGRKLINEGKLILEELSEENDGEAMRMLAYLYLNLLGIHEKSIKKGEHYFLKSYEAGCYFAANDLATFYQGSEIEKAKFYYKEAERHGCRVIENENLET